MKKAKVFLWLAIITVAIIFLIILSVFSKKIPLNDEMITGNTAGNLYNRGLFCETADGVVYFANPYDSNALYSMNVDESNIKKISNVSVEYLNCDGRRIYYYQSGTSGGQGLGYIRQSTGVYRTSLNGTDTVCLKKDPTAGMALCGNYLYYQHYTKETGTYLDKIKIDKSNEKTLLTEAVSPASIHNGIIYYAGVKEDHYLYALDTATDTTTLLWEHNMYNPIYHNGYIYFMDLETDYELHRYDLASGAEEVITTDRLDFYNIYDNIIYYQKSSSTEPALKRIYLDGSNEEVVMNGVFSYVNLTSQYAYFQKFDDPTTLYHQHLYGMVDVSALSPVQK